MRGQTSYEKKKTQNFAMSVAQPGKVMGNSKKPTPPLNRAKTLAQSVGFGIEDGSLRQFGSVANNGILG